MEAPSQPTPTPTSHGPPAQQSGSGSRAEPGTMLPHAAAPTQRQHSIAGRQAARKTRRAWHNGPRRPARARQQRGWAGFQEEWQLPARQSAQQGADPAAGRCREEEPIASTNGGGGDRVSPGQRSAAARDELLRPVAFSGWAEGAAGATRACCSGRAAVLAGAAAWGAMTVLRSRDQCAWRAGRPTDRCKRAEEFRVRGFVGRLPG